MEVDNDLLSLLSDFHVYVVELLLFLLLLSELNLRWLSGGRSESRLSCAIDKKRFLNGHLKQSGRVSLGVDELAQEMRGESFLHEPLILGLHIFHGVQVDPLGKREDQMEEVVEEQHQQGAHLVDGKVVEEPDRPDELGQIVVLVSSLLRELHVDRQVDADEQRGDRDLLRKYLLYDTRVKS